MSTVNFFSGDRLKSVREAKRMSQDDFAAAIPCSKSMVCQLELGGKIPSEQIMKLICVTYGVNRKYLEGEDGAPMFDRDGCGGDNGARWVLTAQEELLIDLYRELGDGQQGRLLGLAHQMRKGGAG